MLESITSENQSLTPRVLPKQQRAKESLEKILNSAEHLLSEEGLDGFNTNRLAELAGVKVRTIYRYYPNKYAVLCALAQRHQEYEMALLEDGLKHIANPEMDWRLHYSASVQKSFDMLLQQPNIINMRRAMMVVPQIKEVLLKHNRKVADSVACAFQQRGATASYERLLVMGQLVCWTIDPVFEYIITNNPDNQDQIINDIIQMHCQYIEVLI